jgi:hypothetical protein
MLEATAEFSAVDRTLRVQRAQLHMPRNPVVWERHVCMCTPDIAGGW